jgi:hypothetical protein
MGSTIFDSIVLPLTVTVLFMYALLVLVNALRWLMGYHTMTIPSLTHTQIALFCVILYLACADSFVIDNNVNDHNEIFEEDIDDRCTFEDLAEIAMLRDMGVIVSCRSYLLISDFLCKNANDPSLCPR